MKNLYYTLSLSFAFLLFYSCTNEEYQDIEDNIEHQSFNEKYGFRDVDLSFIENPDSILHFATIEEAEQYLLEYQIVSTDEIKGHSSIKIEDANGATNARYPNQDGGDLITLIFKVSPVTSYKLKFKVTYSGQQISIKESDVHFSFSGLTFSQGVTIDNVLITRKAGGSFNITIQATQSTYVFVKSVGKVADRDLLIKATYNPYNKSGRIDSIVDDEIGPIEREDDYPSSDPFGSRGSYGTYGSSGSYSGSGSGSGYSGSYGSGSSGSSYSSGSGFTYGTYGWSSGTGYSGSASGTGFGSRGGSRGSSGSGSKGEDSGSGSCSGGGTKQRPCPPPPIARTDRR